MIETWTIVDPGLAQASTGHHYTETKAVADELEVRGMKARILGYSDLLPGKFPDIEVVPCFSLFSYAPRAKEPAEHLREHNIRFERDMRKLDQTSFKNALVFFPTLRERHLPGLMAWLHSLKEADRPIVVVVLTELSVPANPFIAGVYHNVWASFPEAIKRRIVLCARTPTSVSQFEKILGTRPHLLPSPLGVPARLIDGNSPLTDTWAGRMVVSFMGNARESKGCAIIPDVVRASSGEGIYFFLQVKPDAAFAYDMSAIYALAALPNVEIREGFLPEVDYFSVIKKSIVLLAYRPQAYRWQSSGVFIEAASLGAPMIVSDGTWMSEEVKAAQNGLVFRDYTPGAIARCIAEAKARLPELRANAAVYARKFRAQNGPDRCVDEVLRLVGDRLDSIKLGTS